MKEFIIIDNQKHYYESVDLQFAEGPQISFEQAKDILFTTKEALENSNIRFWLIYGTLLGAIRERSFIPHDFDVDIQTDEFEKFLKAIPTLEKYGLRLIRVQEGRVYSFAKGNVYIDVYIKRDAPFPLNLWCYWLNGNIVPKKYLKTFKTIDFLGESFLVPIDPEGLLAFFYGKTWRTPIPGVHGRYDIIPVHFYRKYLKKYIKRS